MYCAGVTTVCDMGYIGEVEEVWEALEQVYMPAADKGELPIRVFAMVPLTTWYCLLPVCSHYHHCPYSFASPSLFFFSPSPDTLLLRWDSQAATKLLLALEKRR